MCVTNANIVTVYSPLNRKVDVGHTVVVGLCNWLLVVSVAGYCQPCLVPHLVHDEHWLCDEVCHES